jgi:hypothetical protein
MSDQTGREIDNNLMDEIRITGPGIERRTIEITSSPMTIGRGEINDIVLKGEGVSNNHARIERDGSEYRITDLDSQHGTFLENIRILAGVPENWENDFEIRIGNFELRLIRKIKETPDDQPSSIEIDPDKEAEINGDEEQRIALRLSESELTVDPGNSTTAQLTILNQGTIVDIFQVHIEGIPSAWLASQPEDIRLMPSEQETVSLKIQPPRLSESKAGPYHITIRAASLEFPNQSSFIILTLSVHAFSEFHCELHPQKIRSGSSAKVIIQNRGNSPEQYSMRLQDRAEDLQFQPAEIDHDIEGGKKGEIHFQADPRQRRWVGRLQSHLMTATISSSGELTQTLSGEITSRGLIPSWLIILAGFTLVAIIFLFSQPGIEATFEINPLQVQPGTPVSINWSVINASSVEIEPIGEKKLGGTRDEMPNSSTTYTLTANHRFRRWEKYSITQQVEVLPVPPQPTPVPIPSPIPEPSPEPSTEITAEFDVFPRKILKGEEVTISWVIENADEVMIEIDTQPPRIVDQRGEISDTPDITTTYQLRASNEMGQEMVSEPIRVSVDIPTDTELVLNLSLSRDEIDEGESLDIRWFVRNAESVELTPFGNVELQGNRADAPIENTTYTLIATDTDGQTKVFSETVRVIPKCLVPLGDNENKSIRIYNYLSTDLSQVGEMIDEFKNRCPGFELPDIISAKQGNDLRKDINSGEFDVFIGLNESDATSILMKNLIMEGKILALNDYLSEAGIELDSGRISGDLVRGSDDVLYYNFIPYGRFTNLKSNGVVFIPNNSESKRAAAAFSIFLGFVYENKDGQADNP